MKKYQLLAACIMFALNSSVVTAGAISDVYTKGDVLTASKLDNIKAAVNDNNNASRFYGDGSAGPLTISANTDWSVASPAGDNLNFSDVVIDASAILTVPAGTIIRCTGTFTNNGLIVVKNAENSARLGVSAGKGNAAGPATIGRSSTTSGFLLGGGRAGKHVSKTVAASSFNNFSIGGGAGAGEINVSGSNAGGLIKIYCQGVISNRNEILASGANGENPANGVTSGGGAGGIIILASSTSIDNTGAIKAEGGKGSSAFNNSTGSVGASGGGGGGIIVFVAPTITTASSTLFVTGGVSGTGNITMTNSNRIAGSGGGASGGDGGKGGNIGAPGSSSNVANYGTSGQAGYVLQIHANPASMM